MDAALIPDMRLRIVVMIEAVRKAYLEGEVTPERYPWVVFADDDSYVRVKPLQDGHGVVKSS